MPPAVDLARRYGEALAALRAVHAFDAWLGEHWQERCPPPGAAPAASTSLGTAGEITWHEAANTVVGYLPGQDGCFRIGRDAVMPEFHVAGAASPPPFENDVVISAEMQDEQPPSAR